MGDFIRLTDIPIVLCIALGALLPELIRGFEEKKTLTRLGILTGFCILSSFLTYALQHGDPGAAFSRAFLIGICTRISLVMNHSNHAIIPILKALLTELREHNARAHPVAIAEHPKEGQSERAPSRMPPKARTRRNVNLNPTQSKDEAPS